MRKGKKNTLILDWYMKWKPSLIKINKRITQFSYLNFLELGSNSPHYILVKIITKSKWKMNYAFSFFSGQKHSQFHPLSCLRNLALLAWNIASNPLSAFLYDNNCLPWWTQRNVSHLDTLDGPHTRPLDNDLKVRDCRSYFLVGIQLRLHCIHWTCNLLWQPDRDQVPRICDLSQCASHPDHGDSNKDHGYHRAHCGSDMCI